MTQFGGDNIGEKFFLFMNDFFVAAVWIWTQDKTFLFIWNKENKIYRINVFQLKISNNLLLYH